MPAVSVLTAPALGQRRRAWLARQPKTAKILFAHIHRRSYKRVFGSTTSR
jgi:hypothetical protein